VAEQVAPTPLRAAVEARDQDAVLAAFADDAVLWSPIFETPFTGTDEIGDLFAVLLEVLWPITYEDEIPGDPHILHFTGEIKGKQLEGIDLLRFDEQGRVKEITVFFRPFPAVAAFLSATGPKLGRLRGGAARGAAMAAGAGPVGALMRSTASIGPRLLGLKSAKRSG
jgi:SnoaL-like domain